MTVLLRFHFDSLAYDNDCEDYSIDQPIERLPGDKIFIVGEQKITKNDEDQKIKIALAVIRIQDKYDLVISVNNFDFRYKNIIESIVIKDYSLFYL